MGECHLVAANAIEIGTDCAISWDTQIMDTDFHKIYSEDELINKDKKVCIENHAWIASHVTVNKGAIIPDDCVIASHSLINSKIYEKGILIAGVPGKCLKTSINWEM